MDNLNTITYDDGWKDAYTPVYKEDTIKTADDPVVTKSKKQYNMPYLLVIQLILCLLLLISAFAIKSFGGGFYKTARSWYYENLRDEIIMTDSFESFDLDAVLGNED